MCEKMRMASVDLTEKNIEKIGELFPNCITETKDKDGNLKKAINFDILKQMLSKDIVEGDEAYEFTWVGKKAAMLEANKPIRKTLRPCPEESVNWDTTENLYIEGDNLEVLKLLQESYLGKVKMIYIDPPYNTGSDFIYPDSFIMDNEEYNLGTGYFDKDGNVNYARENCKAAGKYHSDWCSMIYSRLLLAKNLLSEDGVIFISIDDNELVSLKKICNEIFGETNFLTNFIWEKTQHFGRQKLNSYCNADYVVCYAKNKISDKIKELMVEKIEDNLLDAPLYNNSNKVNSLLFPKNTVKFNLADGTYSSTDNDDYELVTPVVVKDGKNANDFNLRFKSRWSNQTVQEEIAKGTTFWVKSKKFAIRAIYGKDKTTNVAPKQIIFTNPSNPTCVKDRLGYRVETNENASNSLEKLFGCKVFDYPKPISLIRYFISLLYNETNKSYDDNFIVLDFFAGSASTAHAVMDYNSMENQNVKFISVQLPEKLDEVINKAEKNSVETLKSAIKYLDSIGKKHLLTEIGKSRIRLANSAIHNERADAKFDGGFRVFKLDDTNMNDVYYSAGEYSQGLLSKLESNIKEDRTDLDLLFGCLLEWGLPLSMQYKSEKIENFNVHTYNDGDLIACFDENISENIIKEIANRKPIRAVFRDSSFADSPAKINVTEIFKLLSPNTQIKVI